MEWSERMGQAIDYLENHLSEDIDIGEAARLACCSSFHFQKMFFVITGITAGEYIRHRRLTMAAQELSSTKNKVIDIALKYGYDSPDAFSRAFRNMHGITPQAAREPGVHLVAYPRISFQIVLKGGQDMDYKIVNKAAFEVFGKARQFTNVNQENFKKIPLFWDELKLTADYEKICCGQKGPVTGALVLGVCYMSNGMDKFYYAIGAEKSTHSPAAGMDIIKIPASTWAVFESRGAMPQAIQIVTRRIYDEWFPSTGFEHAGTPEMEVYLEGDIESPDYCSQVWIPVKKKTAG